MAEGGYGLNMHPLLLCPEVDCGRTVETPHRLNRNGVNGPVECPECFKPMMLVSYGIVEREAQFSDLDPYALRRAQGTWWR